MSKQPKKDRAQERNRQPHAYNKHARPGRMALRLTARGKITQNRSHIRKQRTQQSQQSSGTLILGVLFILEFAATAARNFMTETKAVSTSQQVQQQIEEIAKEKGWQEV